MSTFISALRNGAKLLQRRDDDGFDRLSNRYSVGKRILRLSIAKMAAVVEGKQRQAL